MVTFSRVIAGGVELYLHKLPDFRGKRRLLLPLNRLTERLPVRSRYGVVLGMDVADLTNWYGLSGRYGRVVADAIATLREGDCFIDVGANCGVFALLAAQRVGRSGLVIAFEPCFETYSKLVANIGLNKAENVLPFNLAITNQSGMLLLRSPPPSHSGRCAVAQSRGSGEPAGGIDLKDFPALLTMIGDRRTLIKIDVEGYEFKVLRGLTVVLKRAETYGAIVEIDEDNLSGYGDNAADVYDCLKQFGFDAAGGARQPAGHFDQVFSKAECEERPRLFRPGIEDRLSG